MFTKNNHTYTDIEDSFEQFAESTNPFPTKSFVAEKHPASSGHSSKEGKRPRIYKPLYSVRLS